MKPLKKRSRRWLTSSVRMPVHAGGDLRVGDAVLFDDANDRGPLRRGDRIADAALRQRERHLVDVGADADDPGSARRA